jgi:hypothetical protein
MPEEHEYKAPADLHHEVAAAAEELAGVVGPSALVGSWHACDSATRGIVRIDIAAAGQGITVHAFGACVPNPCDWGTVPGLAYAANVSSNAAIAFSAQYKFGFVETIVVGVLDNGSLVVEDFNHFTDGSGRSDYYEKGYFCKGRRARHE